MFTRMMSKLQARGFWAEAQSADTLMSGGGGNVVDMVSQLISGVSEAKEEVVKDESEEADTQPDDSNQDSDENAEGEEEAQETEVESEDEPTWANVLGVDDKNVVLDEEGNLSGINVKIDGKISTVAVKDLIAGYQTNKSNTNKSKAIAEERKEFDAIKSKAATEYTSKLEVVDKLTAHIKDKLVGEYKNIDWNRLRAENPGEYAAAVQDFNLRSAELDQIVAAVNSEKQGVQQELTQEQVAFRNQYIATQAEKVLENNPTWAKPEQFKKAISEMTDFVGEAYGFTTEEFNSVQDARLLEIVKDAMRYRNGTKLAKEKLTVVVPKFQKSNGTSTKTVSKLDKLVKKAKTSTGYSKRFAETDAVAALLSGLE